MEGRCLLSAMTLQFSALSLPGTQDTTQVSLTTVIGGQQAASSPIVEGGYIDLGGLQSQSTNHNYVLPVVSGVGGAGVGGAGGPTVTDILTSNDSYSVPFSDSTTNGLTQFDTLGGGFGMRPVVISPSIGLSEGTPRVDPGRSLTIQVRGRQEGGIVQIDKILGDERIDPDQFAVTIRAGDIPGESSLPADSPSLGTILLAFPSDSDGRKPALASAASTELNVSLDQPDQRASDLIAPAKNSLITGELARAMVFELAGGEPAYVRPVISSDKIRSLAPTNSQDAPRADVPPLSPAATHQAALQHSGSRIRLTGNLVEFPLSPADSLVWSGVADSRVASHVADAVTAPVRDGYASFNGPDIAVAEVFAELGRSEQPPVRSSFEEDAQTGPLVAGSVIALLMLERAAARYKSRAERRVLTVVAGPPRI
jgi:hypothetical protein